MAKMMVPMSTGQVDPYISEQVTGMQIRSTPAEFPLVLLSTSSISILSSIVVVSMASQKDAHHAHARALLLHPFLCAIRKHNARS